MSKNSSAKYHQDNNERLKKRPVKDIKIFLKKERNQKHSRERYKNLSEDEKKKLFEYKKNIIKWEKALCYN